MSADAAAVAGPCGRAGASGARFASVYWRLRTESGRWPPCSGPGSTAWWAAPTRMAVVRAVTCIHARFRPGSPSSPSLSLPEELTGSTLSRDRPRPPAAGSNCNSASSAAVSMASRACTEARQGAPAGRPLAHRNDRQGGEARFGSRGCPGATRGATQGGKGRGTQPCDWVRGRGGVARDDRDAVSWVLRGQIGSRCDINHLPTNGSVDGK